MQHQMKVMREKLAAGSKEGSCNSDLELRSCEVQFTPYEPGDESDQANNRARFAVKSRIFSA